MRVGAMQGLRFDRRTLRDLQGRESVVVERVNVKPENPAAGLRVGAALAPLMFFTLSACAGRLSLDPVAPPRVRKRKSASAIGNRRGAIGRSPRPNEQNRAFAIGAKRDTIRAFRTFPN